MSTSDYLSDVTRRRWLADQIGGSEQYLYQIHTGRRKAGPELAKRIEVITNGELSRHDLRPDIFDPPPSNSNQQEAA